GVELYNCLTGRCVARDGGDDPGRKHIEGQASPFPLPRGHDMHMKEDAPVTDTMSATSVEARRGDLRMLLGLERLAPGRFVGSRYQLNINGSIYGGQIFAQALNAAFETVEGRVAHSVQASFLRPAVDGVPIEYE